MAFKMRGFPMQQTSALKQKVKVFGGRATVDVSTDAGKKLLEEIKSIKTVPTAIVTGKPLILNAIVTFYF